jgi:hypothetical protein
MEGGHGPHPLVPVVAAGREAPQTHPVGPRAGRTCRKLHWGPHPRQVAGSAPDARASAACCCCCYYCRLHTQSHAHGSHQHQEAPCLVAAPIQGAWLPCVDQAP